MGENVPCTMTPRDRDRVLQLKEAARFSGGIRMGRRLWATAIRRWCQIADLGAFGNNTPAARGSPRSQSTLHRVA
jgi:hypothetical protein